MGAPRLTILKDKVTREISVEVFEAMPALEEVECVDTYEDPAPFRDLEPVCLALERYTALYHLRKLDLCLFQISTTEWERLLAALAGAPCAPQLTYLGFTKMGMTHKSMSTLSMLLAKDTFPKLEALSPFSNIDIGDAGVVSLSLGLLEPPQTRLKELRLSEVGMGDGGMAAIANIIRAGRFEGSEGPVVGWNTNMTNEGMCAFVLVVQAGGKHTFKADIFTVASIAGLGVRAWLTALA